MTTTIEANSDAAEVAKFDAIAATWWDPEGEFKPLHELNPVRLAFVRQHTELLGQRVADVGCGGGILSEAMARSGADVTGVDLAMEALGVAKAHAAGENLNINYQHTEISDFAEANCGRFDLVTCMELLEHVPDPARLVADCAALLRPGGTAFFSTINRTARAYALAVVGAEYLMRLLPVGTHDYKRFIKPAELSQFIRSAGLDLGRMRGIHYNPLTKAHGLNSNVSVNYIVAATKPE